MKTLLTLAMVAAVLSMGCSQACAQAADPSAAATIAQAAPGQPVVLDHVIAVINGDVLLQSDVDEERRFAVLEPFSVPVGSDTLSRAARRLANRTLILQQMKEQQLGITVSDEDLQKVLSDLRDHLPKCRKYKCTTEDGWKAYLAANDLTETEVNARWRQRLMILKFIDLRFRSGIRIPKEEIEAYYTKSILPAYAQQNEKPPPVAQLSDRIQELLLQQHVNGLLQDWLKSLRDEGSVQILDPAYGSSSGGQSGEEDDD
jgi:peptidyl-prolyl cis-trans isomerase SurA